jgi:hypothetical protein
VTINDPRDISGLRVWYSADYEKTLYADGATVTTLHDLSGNGFDASATPGETGSILRYTTGPGGGPCFEASTSRGFQMPSGVFTGLTAAEAEMTAKPGTGNDGMWYLGSAGSISHFSFGGQVYDSFGTTVRKDGVTTVTNGTWYRYRAMSKAGGWQAWKDGASVFSTGSNAVNFGTNRWLMKSATSSYFLAGMGMFVLYGRELTAGERTDLETWIAANRSGGVQYVPAIPNTPTGLDVDEGVTNLELSWTASTGSPTGYDVRINGGSPIDVGNVLLYDFTGLTPETAYTLEVRAYSAGGDSSWASIGGTTLDLPSPTGLTILGSDEDTITLGWDTHAYATGFEVRIDGGTPEDVGLTTLHMWDGLDPFTMYQLEVRAYLGAVFSDWASIDGDTDLPAPPEGSYTVTLKVGAHEWIITHEDVLDIDAEVHVLDGLRLGWELNESDPWPSQPEPATIDVGFYATNVEELDVDLAIGTPMYAILEDGDGNVFATFHGRVTESRATPIKRKAGLRMLYQIKGDDYTVDLDEATVTITADWPAEAALDRMYRIDQVGRSAGISMVLPGAFGAGQFELLTAGTYTMRQLIAETLRQMILPGPVRYIVAPVVDVDGLLDHFEFVLLENEVDASALPGTFAIIDGLWTIVFPDTEATGVVDAGDVNLNTTWTRLKYRAVNRVKVTGSSIIAEAIRPGPPVRLDLQTTLTDQATADLMAELYLPDTDEALGWVADEFLFYAHRHQEGLLPLWFPDHREDPPVTDAYVNPLVLLRIPQNINLAGTTALAGQRSKASLEIRERRVEVRFALRRQLPTSAGVDLVTYQWVQDNFPTVTYADVDPGLSYYEARLGRAV